VSDEHGFCCGQPVDERTGECVHRSHHPRHVTQPMLDEFWRIARQASRAKRDPLLEVLEELFARDAEARGYKPAPEFKQTPQRVPLWLNGTGIAPGENQPAVGAPKDWPHGYLSCGCRDDGTGKHLHERRRW
jgi:hypothetical protein